MSAIDGFGVGKPPAFAATREVSVITRKGLVGTVTVAIPFDGTLADVLRSRSGLGPADALLIVRGDHVVASSPTLVAGKVHVGSGQTKTITIGTIASERSSRLRSPISRACGSPS